MTQKWLKSRKGKACDNSEPSLWRSCLHEKPQIWGAYIMSVGEAVANDALCKAQKVITCAVRGEAVANDALCKAQKVITWALRG